MMKIVIGNVGKDFGAVRALARVSIEIEHGSFTTLLGPSGCGKTTLLRCLAGLEYPDSGEIFVGERCFFSHEKGIFLPVHRRTLGMVFQDFALWPHMTVFENVAFSLRADGRREELKEKVHTALQMVRLEGYEDRYPHQLSGGQQQRVAFARAVANRPEVILFDEPLSALDAKLRDDMRLELKTLVKKMGITAVYVTHDQEEAMSVSDRIVVMNNGRIIQADTPEGVYHHPKNLFVAGFIGKSNWLDSDKRTMVRPEKISIRQTEKARVFRGKVIDNIFRGNSYEIHVDIEEVGCWMVSLSQPLPIGDKIELFVAEKDIIHFK